MVNHQLIRFIMAIAMIIGVHSVSKAQFTQPYLMKEGLQSVKKAAADSGWKNPVLTSVVTLGDTTGLGQASALIGGGFDMKTGRSTVWIYVLAVTDATGNSTTKLLAYIKVPLLGLQQFPLPADAVPGDVPFIPEDSIPTSTITNSDMVATKINANPSYQAFSKANPKAKSAFIVLFASPFAFPETPFVAGDPLWNFNFTDPADSLAPAMSCFVHAVTGETVCLEAPSSVDEQIAENNSLSMTIHPIPQGINGQINLPDIKGGQASLEVMDLFGRIVFSISLVQSTSGHRIQLPILPAGMYVAKFIHEGTISSLKFIQQ
ncbi:MAG: T9SS type A sorting domain-containing protein [bacterium]